MSRVPGGGPESPESFGTEGELARVLRAERDAPAPDGTQRDRMWARLSATLAVPPAAPVARALPVGKVLVALCAVGAVATSLWWRDHPRASGVVATLAPVASVAAPSSTVSAPAAPATPVAQAAVVPAPAEPFEPVVVARPSRPRVGDSLGAERKLIDEAREALAHGRPRLAEAALLEHDRRFRTGQLREERESLAVRTELTLGRPAAARVRAAAFLARDPESLFAPVVRALEARAKASLPDDDTAP